MPVNSENIALIHKKEFQMMTQLPVASVNGSFVCYDVKGFEEVALFVQNATTQYLYNFQDDGFTQLPSFSLAGTFGSGACGVRERFSATINCTAAGTTTTVIAPATLGGNIIGKRIRFLSGAAIGQESVITNYILNTSNSIIVFSPALTVATANTDTFVIEVGRFFVLNAGTQAAGSFKSYDLISGTLTNLAFANLPATITSECKLVATPSFDIYASGTATSATSTTLVNSAKTWIVNQWINYQVRITAGTGNGQIRTITANNATTLQMAAWTITPDTTSQYAIEANDDFLYLIGNSAITMYRYSKSANTWTVMAPTIARSAATGAGCGAIFISKSGNTLWANENDIRDGKYIYSWRGGGVANVDRFDITAGSGGAGSWLAIPYTNSGETFTTGSSYVSQENKIFIKKDATNRFFVYDVVTNSILGFTTNAYPDGAAASGNKLMHRVYQEGNVTKLRWIYSFGNTNTVLHRVTIF